jgi:hypothetical protein
LTVQLDKLKEIIHWQDRYGENAVPFFSSFFELSLTSPRPIMYLGISVLLSDRNFALRNRIRSILAPFEQKRLKAVDNPTTTI